MYSAYKLSKQGDNIQPWRTPFSVWNQARTVVDCNQRTAQGTSLAIQWLVKTLPSIAGGSGWIPGRGATVPHASGTPTKKTHRKQKQYCNKFNKEFFKRIAHKAGSQGRRRALVGNAIRKEARFSWGKYFKWDRKPLGGLKVDWHDLKLARLQTRGPGSYCTSQRY